MKIKVMRYGLLAISALAVMFAFKAGNSNGGDNASHTMMIRYWEVIDESDPGKIKLLNVIRDDGAIEVLEFKKETHAERMKMLLHKMSELHHLGYKLSASNSTQVGAGGRYAEYVFVK